MIRSWHIRWRIVGGSCWYLQKLKLRGKMNDASTVFSLRTLWLVNLVLFANSIIIIQAFQRFRVSRVTYYICVWCAMKCVCNSCEGMESYARCKTPVSGTSVNIKELQTTEKRNVLLSVVSNAQYNAQQHCSMMHLTMKSLGKDSLWRTVEKQMSISISVSNPEINPFDDREVVWLPCAGKSSALARNSPKRSHGKVYSK
ncbi:putative biopolymer transport protein ExbD-like [Trichinella spiralis]|uniref:Biopolymer transport protein ExbD-like n=1 Tax=Trichinella spiralis TaxID=6334 RepID=A0ABR3K8G8_TRISP